MKITRHQLRKLIAEAINEETETSSAPRPMPPSTRPPPRSKPPTVKKSDSVINLPKATADKVFRHFNSATVNGIKPKGKYKSIITVKDGRVENINHPSKGKFPHTVPSEATKKLDSHVTREVNRAKLDDGQYEFNVSMSGG